MYKPHTHCRACGYGKHIVPDGIKSAKTTEHLVEVFNLGLQPLPNDFVKDGEERAGFAPLAVLWCPNCSLAQLSVVVDRGIIYDKYVYVTSPSKTMLDHFLRLYEDLKLESPSASTVLEIGSNDGVLLSYLQSYGMTVHGIDPAGPLVRIANEHGAKTTCGLFNSATATGLGTFDIIIARHVFNHIDDWGDFIHSLDTVCGGNGIIALEFPHVSKLLENREFDTIYHEHLSYVGVKPLMALLKDGPFMLYKVIQYPIHGGSLMALITRKESGRTQHESVSSVLDSEVRGLVAWKEFSVTVRENITKIQHFVLDAKMKGNRICVFGAAAKSTVLMNACGFTAKQIDFICDSTPQKQYKLSPGTEIPVLDQGALIREQPDFAICCAWNFLPEILAKNNNYHGKWIVPVPEMRII